MPSKIAFFDLDGTLIPKPGSERRFFRMLWRSGKLGWPQLLAAGWFFPRWLLRFGTDVGRKNKAYLYGLRCDEVEALAAQWVKDCFDELIDRQVSPEIERCREAGYRLVLLTGTPDFLARPIAARLRMDDFIATLCQSKDGRFTAAPPTQHPLDYAKLSLARDYCRQHQTQLADCVAYGDSHQDYHLLNAVGKAVAVNPDRRMSLRAASNNWLVITSG